MILYAAVIFLSAFLLFEIQPIIAKSILPWFGGTAAVWTTCLLFFQFTLLLGYLYAHATTRYLSPKAQGRLHILLLLSSLPLLFVLPQDILKPTGTEEPTARILLLLCVKVGLPYFLISTTGPLLQAWIARPSADGTRRAYPYKFYALSNFGSMLGLLSYPFLVEPLLALKAQAWTWAAGYGLYAALCIAAAVKSMRGPASSQALPAPLVPDSDTQPASLPTPATRDSLPVLQPEPRTPTSPALVAYWIVVAACSSTLLLAVTTHITQNVAAIPLLWIVPLSLYLLTFILAFGGTTWVWHKALLPFPVLAIAAMGYALSGEGSGMSVPLQIGIFTAGTFFCCLVCHGELARLKPHPSRLTGYYLALSFGGALGGLFVGLLAPRLFPGYYELPLSIGAIALIALFGLYYERPEPSRMTPVPLSSRLSWVTLAVLTVWFLNQMGSGTLHDSRDKDNLALVRNFYGVLKVSNIAETDDTYGQHQLTHGTILHGEQYTNPTVAMLPTTYYGPDSGVGLAVRIRQARPALRVGIIGLGTGTMAAWGRAGDFYRFYDINPLVRDIALKYFTYVPQCKARTDIVLGDARLSLEKEPNQNYDILVVDAFSSDSIPVHLLTREAFALYFRQLRPDGILAVHVSNRYLNLAPVVKLSADAAGRAARYIQDDGSEENDTASTEWVLVTGDTGLFDAPLLRKKAEAISPAANLRVWTDDYSNLIQILRHRISME